MTIDDAVVLLDQLRALAQDGGIRDRRRAEAVAAELMKLDPIERIQPYLESIRIHFSRLLSGTHNSLQSRDRATILGACASIEDTLRELQPQ